MQKLEQNLRNKQIYEWRQYSKENMEEIKGELEFTKN